MQRLRVRYADEQGRTREELLETSSVNEMRRAFHDKGYYILSETKESDSFWSRLKHGLTFRSGVSVKELNEFTKLLRTLLKSGMPITDAIEVLLDGGEETSLNIALRKIHSDIREGMSMSRALSRHPEVFPDIYIKTIVAGEKAGALENILKRLSEYFASSIAIRRKVVGALIYPAILLVVMSVAVTYMVVGVVPEFAGLFKSIDVPLPILTSLLLDTSQFMGEWFFLLLFAFMFSIGVLIAASRTPEGKARIDSFKLKIPLINELERNFAYSQFSRTMATMIEGGIPILDSLGVVLDSLENKVISARFSNIPDLIEKGQSFGKALKSIPEVPGIMVRVVHVGEESGNLGEMLENLADHYDEEITELTDTITSLIEPIMFLLMAAVVGTVIIALLMPILTAATKIN